MYKEVVRWSKMGQGNLEETILDILQPGETKVVNGKFINELIALKNYKTHEPLVSFKANPKSKYLLYYNYHPSSGYNTTFDVEGNFNIEKPQGGSLSAFFSEVVILEETGKVIPFKRK